MRRLNWIGLWAGALCCAWLTCAAAQDGAAGEATDVAPPPTAGDSEIDLGEIEIEGDAPAPVVPDPPTPEELAVLEPPSTLTRTGAQTQIIPADQIAASGATSVAELLQRASGFSVSDSFTGAAVSFQGLPSKFTTVLVDGQRVPGSIMERTDFGQLPLDNVERIEIIRGPQASAFSGSSIGAVVNIITRTPQSGETQGSLTTGAGSLGYGHARLSLNGGSEDGHERWLFALERTARQRYDLDVRQPDTDGDGFSQQDLLAKFSKGFGPNTLRLQLDWFDEQRRGNTYAPPNLLRNNDTGTRRFQLDGAWRWGLGDGGSMELRHNFGSYNHDLHRYYVGFEQQSGVRTGFTDALHDTQLSYQQRSDGSGLAAGVQRSYDKLSSDRINVGGAHNATAEAWAGYASYVWQLDGRWSATGALRYDTQDKFGGEASPKLALRYALDAHSALSASAGRGYRAPSLREQYYEFASPFGYSVVGNADLVPESSWDYALDYDYAGQKGRAHAGAFYHDVQDLIDFSQIQASPQVFKAVNIGQATTYGLEMSAERNWTIAYDARRDPARTWGAGWDTTWIAYSEDGATGNALPGSPEWSHSLRLFYGESEHDLRAQLLLRSVGARWLDLENTDRAPGYATVDATLARELGDGRIELAGLNLLDTADGRYGPEPGRELRASYTWEF
jgi:outer membrane cobalamin receptor